MILLHGCRACEGLHGRTWLYTDHQVEPAPHTLLHSLARKGHAMDINAKCTKAYISQGTRPGENQPMHAPGTPFPAADQARAPTARTPACIRCRTAAAAGPLPLPGTAAIEDRCRRGSIRVYVCVSAAEEVAYVCMCVSALQQR
eukprot:1157619-Pelagomonas_calceolata.AAC.2